MVWEPNKLTTLEEIAKDFYDTLTLTTKQALLDAPLNAYSALGRIIRNEYHLWEDHPLTQKWREDESSRDIRDGVDFSLDHPDQVSANIVDLVVKLVQKGE